MELSREVRVWVDLASLSQPSSVPGTKCETTVSAKAFAGNRWLGTPSATGFGFPLSVGCKLRGDIDEIDGMLVNVKEVDGKVEACTHDLIEAFFLPLRSGSAPRQEELSASNEPSVKQTFEVLLGQLWSSLQTEFSDSLVLQEIRLSTCPQLRYSMQESGMTSLIEQFEFSAAHFLQSDLLNAEENERRYGKCFSPSGHGHNYVFDVVIEGKTDPRTGKLIELEKLERIVSESVLAKLDHRNLNTDVPELLGRPTTVENLAQAIFDWLDGKFLPSKLSRVRLYETAKTFAECDSPSVSTSVFS